MYLNSLEVAWDISEEQTYVMVDPTHLGSQPLQCEQSTSVLSINACNANVALDSQNSVKNKIKTFSNQNSGELQHLFLRTTHISGCVACVKW